MRQSNRHLRNSLAGPDPLSCYKGRLLSNLRMESDERADTSWLLTVSDETRPMVRAADTCANGSCFAVELTNNGVRRMDPPQITFGESLRRGHTGTLYLRPGCVPVATASLSELSSKDDVPLRRRAPAPPALLGLTLSLLRQIHPQQAVTPPLPAKR